MAPIPKLSALNKLVGSYRSAAYPITFKLPSGFTTDGNGNRVPATTANLIISCRLRPVVGNSEKVQRLEFPGADSKSIMLSGWCDTESTNGLFPDSIRRQTIATGSVRYNGQLGTIQIRVTGATPGSSSVGERFRASFSPN